MGTGAAIGLAVPFCGGQKVTTGRAWQMEAPLRYGATRGEILLTKRTDDERLPLRISTALSMFAGTKPMDASVDVVRSQEQNGTHAGVEPDTLAWARRQIEGVKVGLRDDPGRAYSVEFTAAAEVLREHDPVQFNSLRRLLKDKQVRLGEFDRLIEQRRRESVESTKRNKSVAAARISRTAHAIGRAPRAAAGGVQVGRYLANTEGLFLLRSIGRGAPPIKLPLTNFTARIVTEIRHDDSIESTREFEIGARLGGQTRRLVVAAAQFASMKWVTEQLGARAVIAAGMGIKDQVREAIQLLSATQIVERTVHSHTGWRKLLSGVLPFGRATITPRSVLRWMPRFEHSRKMAIALT
jgi:hypothetical protein